MIECEVCGGTGIVLVADVYREPGQDAKPCWETAHQTVCGCRLAVTL